MKHGNRDEEPEMPNVEDAASEEPVVYAIRREGADWLLDRRSLMKAAMAAGAALGARDAMAVEPNKEAYYESSFAHRDQVRSMTTAPGKVPLLVSAGNDHEVKIWSQHEGALAKTLEGHEAEVNAVAASKDGRVLVSGSSDGEIRLWNLPEGTYERTFEAQEGEIRALAIHPNGRMLIAGGSQGEITLWTLPGGVRLKHFAGHEGAVTTLVVTPDGTKLISGAEGGSIRTWSLPQGTGGAQVNDQEGVVLALSPDGRILASGGADAVIRLRSVDTMEPIATLEGHGARILTLSFNSDGKLLASGSDDHAIRLWSMPDGRLVRTLEGHKDDVSALAFSDDGRQLYSGSHDRSVRQWSVSDGKFERPLIDLAASPATVKGIRYEVTAVSGEKVAYTLPYGTRIPSGGVCVCNTVAGSWKGSGTEAPVETAVPRPSPPRPSPPRPSPPRPSPPVPQSSHYWYPN